MTRRRHPPRPRYRCTFCGRAITTYENDPVYGLVEPRLRPHGIGEMCDGSDMPIDSLERVA